MGQSRLRFDPEDAEMSHEARPLVRGFGDRETHIPGQPSEAPRVTGTVGGMLLKKPRRHLSDQVGVLQTSFPHQFAQSRVTREQSSRF